MNFLSGLLAVIATQLFLSGCQQVRDSNKMCLIGASADRGTVHVAELKSILFIEDRGTLYAKLLQCGSKEYYLGGLKYSNSSAALGKKFFESIKRAQWDGFLSCSDAISAFPYNHQNTTDLLTKLCSASAQEASP